MRGLVLTIAAATSCPAQWILQQSNTTASLRGIHNVGNGIVWASGANGTVLRTTSDGATWEACAVPSSAETLDFRGVQAFDANTAIVMSSGPGGLSRLYKTTDACQTWKLVFANPDPAGFWDALQFTGPAFGALIGDPVDGHFPLFVSTDAGDTWRKLKPPAIPAAKNQSFFAASNTALLADSKSPKLYMITGGGTTSFITVDMRRGLASSTHLDLASGETAGGFSLASRVDGSRLVMVAVGGDYKAPERTIGTAASRIEDHRHIGPWIASNSPPHGYRSAVAYYAAGKIWITVGPNGTDFSTDDGRNWRALKPTAQAPDTGKNWNALSLPFAAGSDGRIGKLTQ